MKENIVQKLTSKDDKYACAFTDRIVAESRDTDEWYEYFEDVASLLDHPKSLVRNRALYILAANAQWDEENRFDLILLDYLKHITDDKPITARQCVKALAQVGLLCPVFSPAFYVFYIAAGLSDMLDGFVARKTDTVSELGARLDTMADFVLVVVCLIKLLPILSIPAWLYIWIGIIALIKVVNIVSGFTVQKKLVAVHSVMNKATGVLLFLMPLTIPAVSLKYSAIVVCAVATFAAIQEGHLIRTGRE